MFTGIVEEVGVIEEIRREDLNIHFKIKSSLSHQLKVDQSVAHQGVCLTVTACGDQWHEVTAIHETLSKTNLIHWKQGDYINLERAMQAGGRLDGHFVQGHVDTIISCLEVQEEGGSWRYFFELPESDQFMLIPKGSVCLNGISLTVASLEKNPFSVAIIPYTYHHTQFQYLKAGDAVNIEYDMMGKYLTRYLDLYRNAGLIPNRDE